MIKKICRIVYKIYQCIVISYSSRQFKILFNNTVFNCNAVVFLNPDMKRKVILDAGKVLNGNFQIYDYDIYISKFPNWLKDPVSNKFLKKRLNCHLIASSSLVDNVDIKNFWEQSNQHWLTTLGQAYSITNDEKYAKRLVDLILNWSKKNPCGTTINWKCTMDVAIRLCNWILGVSLIKTSSTYLNNESMIIKSILLHTIYIYHNLENKSTHLNNHYITNLIGLVWGTAYLERKCLTNINLKNYRKFALENLKQQCNYQIKDLGYNYEMSSYYHCFVTELITLTIVMLEENNIDYSPDILETANKMLAVCGKLGAFNNAMPLIGDQDGSRLFHLVGCLNINRCDFSVLEELIKYYSFLDVKKMENQYSLIQGGIFLLENNTGKCFVKCGDIGTGGNGTHDHNDHLSISYFYKDKEIIIDPGTGVYSQNTKLRNLMRSTSMHNTLIVEDLEQNLLTQNIFQLSSNHISECIEFNNNMFNGKFQYENGILHIRTVFLENSTLTVLDEVICLSGEIVDYNICSQLILPCKTENILVNNNNIVIKIYNMTFLVETSDMVEVGIEKCVYSTNYGEFQEGTKLKLYIKGKSIRIKLKELM